MGAKDDDKDKKTTNEPELQQIELTEEQQELFEDALGTLRGLVDDIAAKGAPIREWALGLTKIEEAEMWIERGFDLLGIEPDLGDENDEDDEDETEEEGEETDEASQDDG